MFPSLNASGILAFTKISKNLLEKAFLYSEQCLPKIGFCVKEYRRMALQKGHIC